MRYEYISEEPDNNYFDTAKFVPPKNMFFPWGKPRPGTGLWGSLAESDDNWRRYLRYTGQARKERSGFRFELSASARLLIVRSVCDMKLLPITTKHNGDETKEGIDWEDLTQNWDAVFVQGKALSTKLLWGWDIPSLLILDAAAVASSESDQTMSAIF